MGNKILDTVGEKATEWLNHFTERNFDKAKEIADINTENLKQIVIKRSLGDTNDLYNSFTIFSIFFKILSEFSEMAVLTKEKNDWFNENKNIEEVWNLMWNCRQRLDFVTKYFSGNITDYLYERLNSLEKFFIQLVGEGIYTSPVIEMEGLICNICGENYKRCNHERHDIFNGVICEPIPIKPKLITADLVQVPKDPRCRVWPWQMKEDMKFDTCIKTFFEIDDFIKSSVANKS